MQPLPAPNVLGIYPVSRGCHDGTVLEVAGALLFLALVAVLYVWTRRTEANEIYEPRVKSEDEANALRLGIA
jgi:hypothetical protein